MSRADMTPVTVVNVQEDIHIPSDCLIAYEFLGTWAIAAGKQAGSSDLHNVYAQATDWIYRFGYPALK